MERVNEIDPNDPIGSMNKCLSELDALRRIVQIPNYFHENPEEGFLARVGGVTYIYENGNWEVL